MRLLAFYTEFLPKNVLGGRVCDGRVVLMALLQRNGDAEVGIAALVIIPTGYGRVELIFPGKGLE